MACAGRQRVSIEAKVSFLTKPSPSEEIQSFLRSTAVSPTSKRSKTRRLAGIAAGALSAAK